MSGAGKVAWVLIITSLLLSEVFAIRRDRREQREQEIRTAILRDALKKE